MPEPSRDEDTPVRNPAPPVEVVAQRLAGIRERVHAAGGDPALVRIVAVTKGFDESAPRAALAAGLTDVGENYPAELLAKASAVDAPDATWHMVGGIQRRRIKALSAVVDCWQTVSRPEEVSSLARYAPRTAVFVQVDTTGLPGRNGCPPADVGSLVAIARDAGLDVRGLMTIGPGPQSSPQKGFEIVASIARNLDLHEISMGMSDDIEAAVSAGSTMLRVGRGLFGDRPNRG
jgi:uncharacterized pyridoxal phosphate-containing UPF0001 family protein